MKTRILGGILVLGLLGGLAWYLWFVAPKGAPWDERGELIIATYAIPGPTKEDGRALGINIDDVSLIRDTGESVPVTVLSRHLLLSDTDTSLHRMLDTSLAVGSYTGIRITLSSPEQRNNWEEDDAATSVALGGEYVFLDIPISVDKDTVTTVLLGFESNQSLRSLDGATVYLPVIHTETRVGARVDATEDGTVEVREGTILESKMFGMDWDGTVYFNYRAKEGGVTKRGYTPPTPEEPVIEQEPEEAGAERGTATEEETNF